MINAGHPTEKSDLSEKNVSSEKSDSSENLVFCEAPKNQPPDQFRIIMEMVKDICQRMENMEEKMSNIIKQKF